MGDGFGGDGSGGGGSGDDLVAGDGSRDGLVGGDGSGDGLVGGDGSDGGAGGQAAPVVLDGGDRRCVQLLIELRRLVTGLPPGSVVHLVATDPAAPIDLPAWCHLTGHHYLGPLPDQDRPTYAIGVRADARRTEPQSPWRSTPA